MKHASVCILISCDGKCWGIKSNPQTFNNSCKQTSSYTLKTLFNIVEAPFKKFFWTLMSVLYDDVQMDH